jgi:hypothetical protein
MAHTKKEGQKAFEILSQWRGEGVPDLITSYEAHRLTGGVVGKPNSSKGLRLIDVAVKVAKN